jgi:hypothetical protein
MPAKKNLMFRSMMLPLRLLVVGRLVRVIHSATLSPVLMHRDRWGNLIQSQRAASLSILYCNGKEMGYRVRLSVRLNHAHRPPCSSVASEGMIAKQ